MAFRNEVGGADEAEIPSDLRTMIAAGLALIAVAAAIGYAGIGLWNFWIALVLLGASILSHSHWRF